MKFICIVPNLYQNLLSFLLVLLITSGCQSEAKFEAYSYKMYAGNKEVLLEAEQAKVALGDIESNNTKMVKSLTDETAYHLYHTDDIGRDWVYEIRNGEVVVKAEVQGEIFSGKYYSYYENGRIRSIGEYKSGKRTGVWLQFHDNGNQINYGNYNQGNQIGEWYYYDTLEQEREVRIYQDDQSYKSKWYNKNDQLISEGKIVQGKEDGLLIEYDSTGNVKFEANYQMGVLHDTTKLYKEGELFILLVYENGELIKKIDKK
jgi:antitoxin component YwqK of YwqJK toxin-antitoxin module